MPHPACQLAALNLEAAPLGWIGLLLVLAGIAAVVVIYTVGLRGREHPPRRRLGLLGLRLGAIFCLLIALGHPAWTSQREREIKPLLAVVLDDSRSMSLPAGGADPSSPQAGPSRYAKALEALGNNLLPAVRSTHQVRVYDIEGRPLDDASLPAAPRDDHSPIAGTLLALQRDLRGQPLAGFILLSDGLDNSDLSASLSGNDSTAGNDAAIGGAPTSGGNAEGRPEAMGTGTDEAATGLDQLRLPVYALDIARGGTADEGPPDLSIQALAVNHRALVGNTVKATVDIAVEGKAETRTVNLTILQGNKPISTRPVLLRAGEPVTRAEIEFVPHQAGRFTYTVLLGAAEGETHLDHHVQTFPLIVRAKALTVLYIDGVLRWEGKFTREALTSDPDLNVIASVRTAPVGAGRGSPGLLLSEQLTGVDAVILGDVEATYFSAKELEALKKWVTEDGGGLLITGGYHNFGPQGFGRTDLTAILPVEFSAAANPQVEQPFSLKLTEAGRQSPIFHLSGDRVRDTGFYQALPRLDGCSRIAGVKPGAEVLAVNPMISGTEGVGGLPVMVAQQVGAGRTMVFAVDTTYRWRLVVGGFTGDWSFYQRFWGQLVRWLATGEDENNIPALQLATDRYRYRQGQTIELTATLPMTAGAIPGVNPGAGEGWRVTAEGLDEAGHRFSVPMALANGVKSTAGGGRYRGTLAAASPGRVDLTVTAEPLGQTASPTPPREPSVPRDPRTARSSSPSSGSKAPALTPQSQVITVMVDRPDMEMQNTRADPRWLAKVAQLSGGQMLKVEDIPAWASRLPRETMHVSEASTVTLWRHPALICIFFALLCVEWIWRRWSKLA